MSSIVKLSDTEYKIIVTASDISRAFSEDYQGASPEGEGDPSGYVVRGDVSVEFSPDAADTIRDKVSRELTLGMDIGDNLAANRYLHALFSSPVPFSGMYNGLAPSLDSSDEASISSQLGALSTDFTFSFGTVSIGINDRYRLKFIPDARGFDVNLENIELENSLDNAHPFAITLPFVISALDIENPVVTEGVPVGSSSASVNDARVMFYSKSFDIRGGEMLTRAFALSNFSNRTMVSDAYNALFSLSMWRESGGVDVEEIGSRPYSTHLCGVDPSGTAIQYLPVLDLEARIMLDSQNLILTGSTTVSFLVGETRYPFNPIYGLTKALFDVCIDDPGWTSVGPLAYQYIGGEGTEGVNVIHSWTGRKSVIPKRETLSSIGQDRLGG